jgi:hypothetical protein
MVLRLLAFGLRAHRLSDVDGELAFGAGLAGLVTAGELVERGNIGHGSGRTPMWISPPSITAPGARTSDHQFASTLLPLSVPRSP